MTATSAGLSGIGTADLERLCVELSRLAPGVAVSHAMLAGLRLGQLWEVVHVLGVLDAKSLRSLVGAVLSERAARPATHVELVWTGGEGKTAYARPTASVIRELFSSAEHHVLLAGYSFDHGRDIFAPLHQAMLSRAVQVDLYLHLERARYRRDIEQHIQRHVASFFAANWPFGTPHPIIYIAPSCIDPELSESLHAKCCVVDERTAVLGSANFTDRGQSRNIEVGARIDDPGFAQALVGQFRAAANAGVFRRA